MADKSLLEEGARRAGDVYTENIQGCLFFDKTPSTHKGHLPQRRLHPVDVRRG
jgi:hypothetical protein